LTTLVGAGCVIDLDRDVRRLVRQALNPNRRGHEPVVNTS
jgi:hypothetical protein